MAVTHARQQSFDQLGTALIDVTFVVLDLETTGLTPGRDRITEVGAVKVRGGEVLGELQTLVHPGRAIPSAVSAVTGITDAMVAHAPPIEAVLPSVLGFLGDAVFVAHNARFDLSFLRAACEQHHHGGFEPTVVDTARLARRLVRDEVRDRRLGTLARHLGSRVVPDHRALTDARATVDVLHGLIERAGAYGATTLEDLRDLARSTSEQAYRRVGLVRDAPRAAGVYRFLDERGQVLYVGKATDLRSRLRTYFGQDPRRRTADLVRETAEVTWVQTPTLLEAEVVEVRAIHAHAPRYNRRSRHPQRGVHLAVTREAFPRLSIVREPRPKAHDRTLGPIGSRRTAEALVEAIHEVLPLRTCTGRLRVAQDHPACVLKQLGRCGAPCDGSQDAVGYRAVVDRLHAALDDPGLLLGPLRERMLAVARDGRFERATDLRRRIHVLARTLEEQRRLAALGSVERLVAARVVRGDRTAGQDDEVEVVAVAHGRLEVTARTSWTGAPLVEVALGALPPPTLPAGPDPFDAEERRLVLAWLDRPGVRLVATSGGWAEPLAGGRALAETREEARRVDRQVRRDRQVLEGAKVTRRVPAPVAASG
ncbi:DEDD exonuclease domain-containing protein [Nitriliruptor alkaliphilus]|uniref:DEDD exonuclease domain-containing protein n=1 Tax=Nitriliruptor alkaliphilus TaxID=427918 RepID=UPI000698B3EF|nr:DEDD exonuclease domain-containing protein [Nitriliruptor alkaliphilus]